MGKLTGHLGVSALLLLALTACSAVPGPSAATPSPTSAAAATGALPFAQMSPRASLHIGLPEGNTAYVVLYAALDRGYFDEAGLDVTVDHFRGSVTTQMPRLSTGDLDFLPAPPSPALFNQVQQGFGVKLVAGMDQANVDQPVSGWLMLLPDQKDSIKDYADLKGKTIEGAVQGSPIDVFTHAAIASGNLEAGRDVTIKYDVKGDPSDFLNIARNHVVDAMVVPSPLWPPVEQQGYASRWKSAEEIAPWYQTNGLGFSSKALESNRAAVVTFLKVFVYTARQINQTHGQWTDDLVDSAVKWSFGTNTPEQVRGAGGVTTYDPNATLMLDSLHRTQNLWIEEGLVKAAVADADLIDTSPLDEALAQLGKQ
ncbi:MAG: ABC transporter substrate-binding protein [Chloroflexi bacterium]|nr:ABC transporter substrate-binding protein [Chloroflexota bacterium]MBV9598851.1 ABC transporter substrate-binding protein [Chloroflexota bacterium]